MVKLLDAGERARFDKFVSECPKGNFSQTSLWADVKSENWTHELVASVGDDGNIRGTLMLLFRKIPGMPFTIMYGPRGPVCDVHDREVVSELLEGAKLCAKKHHSYVLKLDPDVLSSDAEFTDMMKQFGFLLHADGKNFEGIQPRFVFRLNVENKTEDEVINSFESKTRYNLRLAIRKGVTIRVFPGDGEIPDAEISEFSRLMETTGERDRFMVRGKEYFLRLLKCLGGHSRLYMAYYEDKPVAGTVAIQFGDKTWYLYGASANEYRNVMPNYLLQWEMIRWSLEGKCRIYDFRGVSGDLSEDNPLYGLYRFKKGFNGDFCEFAGEFEYIYNKAQYNILESAQKAYKKLRYKMKVK